MQHTKDIKKNRFAALIFVYFCITPDEHNKCQGIFPAEIIDELQLNEHEDRVHTPVLVVSLPGAQPVQYTIKVFRLNQESC